MPDLIQIGVHPPKPASGCVQNALPRTRVFWLQGVTLLWMVIEFGVSAYAAITAHSPAMLAFGSDSLVELVSAAVVSFPTLQPCEDRHSEQCGDGDANPRPAGFRPEPES